MDVKGKEHMYKKKLGQTYYTNRPVSYTHLTLPTRSDV